MIAVADMLTSGGPRDVVALSVGTADGIDNGTVLSTWRSATRRVDRVRAGLDRSPDATTRGSHVDCRTSSPAT